MIDPNNVTFLSDQGKLKQLLRSKLDIIQLL